MGEGGVVLVLNHKFKILIQIVMNFKKAIKEFIKIKVTYLIFPHFAIPQTL